MREIKFRAWDKRNSEMYYPAIFKIYLIKDGVPDEESLASLRYARDLDNSILMQATGLKDENGIEIYEGDIVVINPDDDSYRDVVIRDKNWLELRSYKNKCVSGCSLYEYHDQIKIIGNIYENPELL